MELRRQLESAVHLPPAAAARCVFCEHPNPPGAHFCNECGSSLDLKACARCGAVDKLTATHCYKCGAAFREVPAEDADAVEITPAISAIAPTPLLIARSTADSDGAPTTGRVRLLEAAADVLEVAQRASPARPSTRATAEAGASLLDMHADGACDALPTLDASVPEAGVESAGAQAIPPQRSRAWRIAANVVFATLLLAIGAYYGVGLVQRFAPSHALAVAGAISPPEAASSTVPATRPPSRDRVTAQRVDAPARARVAPASTTPCAAEIAALGLCDSALKRRED